MGRMKYNNIMFNMKNNLNGKGTYLPRRVSASLAKLGPFFLANAVFLTHSVLPTVLIGCKCPFSSEVRFKLPPALVDNLKNFLLCPTVRSFKDFKFRLTNNKLGFIVSK